MTDRSRRRLLAGLGAATALHPLVGAGRGMVADTVPGAAGAAIAVPTAAGMGIAVPDAARTSLPLDVVAPREPDRWTAIPPESQRFDGLFARRTIANAERRLLHVDADALLRAFEHRDETSHPWIGEHVGKYLDAACAAWRSTRDPRLRANVTAVARRLLATQEADGYLGTYPRERRWTSWDVWVHKYVLIGLLSVHAATGDAAALDACRRIGALLAATFGDAPGQRDIVTAGEHVGMAATSVLEPTCALYRRTGEPGFLAFCEYVAAATERPHGPRIVGTLLARRGVYEVANSKAYEMLSNLVGLLDLHRLNGDPRLRAAVEQAWEDIVRTQRSPTGSMSALERFQPPVRRFATTKSSNVAEGCVTVTWLQLNERLLRMTGDPRYAQEIELTVHNALFAAQREDTGDVTYYTAFSGTRHPTSHLLCCVSSVPRGIAMLPRLAWGTARGALVVHQYTAGRAEARVELAERRDASNGHRAGAGNAAYAVNEANAVYAVDAVDVELESRTTYPDDGDVVLVLRTTTPARFALQLRVPDGVERFTAEVGGRAYAGTAGTMLAVERAWSGTTTVRVRMTLPARIAPAPRLADDALLVYRGPRLHVLDAAANPDVPWLHRVALADDAVPVPTSSSRRTRRNLLGDRSAPTRIDLSAPAIVLGPVARGSVRRERRAVVLVPFADAADGVAWVAREATLRDAAQAVSAFARAGTSSWRTPNDPERPLADPRYVAEHLVDEDPRTCFELDPAHAIAPEANARAARGHDVWAYVVLDRPTRVARFAFTLGAIDGQGGAFDGSKRRPRIEVIRGAFPMVEDTFPDTGAAQWEPLAEFDDYPTTALSPAPAGTRFECVLPNAAEITAFRVVGTVAGDCVRLVEVAAYA